MTTKAERDEREEARTSGHQARMRCFDFYDACARNEVFDRMLGTSFTVTQAHGAVRDGKAFLWMELEEVDPSIEGEKTRLGVICSDPPMFEPGTDRETALKNLTENCVPKDIAEKLLAELGQGREEDGQE